MKKLLLFIPLLFLALGAAAQPGTGLIKPKYIGWPIDSFQNATLKWNPDSLKAVWILDGAGNDSIYAVPDSLCFIDEDTVCVSLDSLYFTPDSVCYWEGVDTTCYTWNATNGNVYTIDGTVQASRTVTIQSTNFFRFRRNNRDIFRINQGSLGSLILCDSDHSSDSYPMLDWGNNNSGDMYLRIGGVFSPSYSIGSDRGVGAYVISGGSNLTANPLMRWYTNQDSIVALADFQIDVGLLDKDGDFGTSGQVLSSTGTEVNWITPASSSIPINSLLAATGTNSINNANFTQEWQWNTLAGIPGLKLASTSTAAASNAQKLLEVSLSGANATSSQTTYAGYFSNTHTGTSSDNYGVYSTASGGSNNYGVYGSGSTNGVKGETTGGIAVNAVATSGTAVSAFSSSGVGGSFVSSGGPYALYASHGAGTALWAESSGGNTGFFSRTDAGTNSSSTFLRLQKFTSGTAANGLGGSIDFWIQTSTGSAGVANTLQSTWVDATHATRTSRFQITGVNSGTSNDIIYFEGDKRTRFNGRAQYQQGADVASVAGAISLGADGNVFEITGTNAITLISSLNWQNGSQVTLAFNSTATLTDGTANSGTDIGIELAGNANFVGSADDVITLVLCEIGGTQRWREVSRAVN